MVYSIEKVADDLTAGDDELKAWVHARGNAFFLKPDQVVVRSSAVSRLISSWASRERN